ncbi:response regulator transcription factor [Streptomyces sp. B1866]|uniref:response regulator transcription factor n=1 Tax=Streptomyces sp. B1866 TaxID=3075431 RepID=UPI00288CAB88|nr:response regulator transcription factor [Streptomyces sp. B1866]MDT3395501.1 response regulator transcription factor [Streptomyces sp. B1866]
MRVLVVQQDEEVGRSLGRFLQLHGYHVDTVRTGAEAIGAHADADLVLLALELPDLDGLTVCREIRGAGQVPVIATIDRGTELDRVLALQAGADSCVSGPYGEWELVARIEAVMRRVSPRAAEPGQVIFRGPLHIDLASREVRLHGRSVLLTRKEFEVLRMLASRPGAVVSREEITVKIWNGNCPRGSRTIDTHISSLRAKLGARTWIRTVRGIGFRMGDA